eukprot:763413-Hanusia_phi.AAC.1
MRNGNLVISTVAPAPVVPLSAAAPAPALAPIPALILHLPLPRFSAQQNISSSLSARLHQPKRVELCGSEPDLSCPGHVSHVLLSPRPHNVHDVRPELPHAGKRRRLAGKALAIGHVPEDGKRARERSTR